MPYVTETTDATNTNSTGYSMGVGDFFVGNISNGDNDWVGIDLQFGQTYTFSVVGVGGLGNGLTDPYFTLYDSAGTQIATDDDSGPGAMSTFTYTATATGTFYLSARAYSAFDNGDYMISATAGTRASYDHQMGAGVLIRYERSWSALPETATTVTYAIRGTGTATDAQGNATAFQQLTSAQIAAAQAGLAMFSDVAGLTFTQVNEGGTSENATILFGAYTSTTDGSGAYAYYPGSTAASSSAGDVWLNNNSINGTSLPEGGYSFFAMIHELGHAMGLAHPGDYNAAPGVSITYAANAQYAEDSHQYTVLSYFDESNTTSSYGSYPDTLMLHDIYALHQLYGANMATRSGDSVYGFNSNVGGIYDFNSNTNPVMAIWDGAGTDTLDVSGFSHDQLIDLNEGAFSNIGGYTANVSIAYGAVIENATGGSGNDTLNGNDAANVLIGNGGNDTFNGGAGNDHIYGLITETIDGGADYDTLHVGTTAFRGYDLAANNIEAMTATENGNAISVTLLGDGSINESAYDTAGIAAYDYYSNTYNSNWEIMLQQFIDDNGNQRNIGYDLDETETFQYYQNTYDSQTRLLTQEILDDNGNQRNVGYDVAETETYASYVNTYDTQNRLTLQQIADDNGNNRVVGYDVDNLYAWTYYQNTYDTGGNLIDSFTV